MPAKTDYAYLAGIIDGEGHVKIKPEATEVILCMADVPILDWCARTFGGTMSSRWKAERGNSRPRRMWFLNRKHGLGTVAPLLLPHLVLKREEMKVVIEMLALTYPGTRASREKKEAWLAEREALVTRGRIAMLARK